VQRRASDKGLIPLPLDEYLQLPDATPATAGMQETPYFSGGSAGRRLVLFTSIPHWPPNPAPSRWKAGASSFVRLTPASKNLPPKRGEAV
jgi:hypothetical protein